MIRVTVQAEACALDLRDAAQRVRDATPAWRVIGTRIKQSILKNFRVGGWYPAAWPKSARAVAEGGQTLVDRGILRNSFQILAGRQSTQVGTAVKYAAVHQFGATIRAKTSRGLRFKIGDQWITKHSVTLPARPFLPERGGVLHPDDAAFVDRTLGTFIAQGRTS